MSVITQTDAGYLVEVPGNMPVIRHSIREALDYCRNAGTTPAINIEGVLSWDVIK